MVIISALYTQYYHCGYIIAIYAYTYNITHARKTRIKDNSKCKFIILRARTSHFSRFFCMWYNMLYELRAYVMYRVEYYVYSTRIVVFLQRKICAVSRTNASRRSYNSYRLKIFTVMARVLWVSWTLT